MQTLMKLINTLKPEWQKPAAWSHAEQRALFEGASQQMAELDAQDWDGLRRYMAAKFLKGFWQPRNRLKFVDTFSDVFSDYQRWEKTQAKPKPANSPAQPSNQQKFDADGGKEAAGVLRELFGNKPS